MLGGHKVSRLRGLAIGQISVAVRIDNIRWGRDRRRTWKDLDRTYRTPDNAQVNRGAVGKLIAGILRVIGDDIVLLVITQELIIGNRCSGQQVEVNASSIGICRIAVGL